MRLSDCHNFHDFRRLAQQRLPGPIFNYIDGAADDETTLRRNTASFERCDLVPNVLRGVREHRHVRDRHGPEAGHAVLLFADRAATAVPPYRRARGGRRGGEIRHDVRRILARHRQPRGTAQGARYAAGLSVLFSQGSRAQPRHDATRQGSRRRGHDADGGQHHRRQSRTRSAHRVFDSLPADAWRHVPVCDQADVGHQLPHA